MLSVMLAFVACGGLSRPRMSPQATSALSPIETAPPPGRVERIPDQPQGADAWVDGEWALRDGRWYWLLGRWVRAPRGATYSPWAVVRASDGTLFYAPSTWHDESGAAIAAPPALAFATAAGGAVVSPVGDPEDTGRVIETAPPAPARNTVDGGPEGSR
jgi:hypothetical protein